MSAREEHKGKLYAFATLAARTERGSYVTRATGGWSIRGLHVAPAGDVVAYDDGSESVIIDGAGSLFVDHGKCAALVGSRLSNGDHIVSAAWNSRKSGLSVREDDIPAGLFDPFYVPPPVERGHRFALSGPTAARGGVLREPSAAWCVNGEDVKVGAIGDRVYYADGTATRITSGIALATNPNLVQFADIGSTLDNGDTITDSPERHGAAHPTYRPIVEALAAQKGDQA